MGSTNLVGLVDLVVVVVGNGILCDWSNCCVDGR